MFLWQDGEVMKQIKSNVEKQLRRTGDSRADEPFEAQLGPASDRREKGYMGHLANYYEEMVAAIRGAVSVFIFGPGEAKGEFLKHLEKHNLGERIKGFRNQFFRCTRAVRVCSIDQVDSEFDRAPQGCDCRCLVRRFAPHALAGNPHRAVAKTIDREVAANRKCARRSRRNILRYAHIIHSVINMV